MTPQGFIVGMKVMLSIAATSMEIKNIFDVTPTAESRRAELCEKC